MPQNVTTVAAASEPDPIPLTFTPKAVAFPVEALPEPVRGMVTHLATATQTDIAMGGTSALTAVSAAVCGRCEIQVRSGWLEPLVIQTASIARPGERKSAVQAAMVAPLLEAEQALSEFASAHRIEAETKKAIAEKAADGARQAAGRATGAQAAKLIQEAIEAAEAAAAIDVPPIPRLLADDVTPEAAASLIADHGGRLAIISSEGGIFDTLAGRYSGNVPHLDTVLKGHSGDSMRVDRRGRPPEFVKRPALTIGLMIQPSVLTALGRHASFRGRGLLGRFLYCIPESRVGRREVGCAPVPAAVEDGYRDHLRALVLGMSSHTDPAILTLEKAAAKLVVDIERTVEPQLAEDGAMGSLADWGGKFVGAILRLAGILHLATHGARGTDIPVTEATLLDAVRLGEYYRAQAIIAFGQMALDEATSDAQYLLHRLSGHGEPVVTVRDMMRIAQRIKTRAALEEPVQRLVDTGWLIPLEVAYEGKGRPPAPTYRVHPKALVSTIGAVA